MFRFEFEPRFRLKNIRKPGWANVIAMSVCPGSNVFIGIKKASGNYALYSIEIPKAEMRTQERAKHYRDEIRTRILESSIYNKPPKAEKT